MIQLLKTKDLENHYDKYDVMMTTDNDVSLSDLFEMFERFLQACGFVFTGYVDIVDDSDIPAEDILITKILKNIRLLLEISWWGRMKLLIKIIGQLLKVRMPI